MSALTKGRSRKAPWHVPYMASPNPHPLSAPEAWPNGASHGNRRAYDWFSYEKRRPVGGRWEGIKPPGIEREHRLPSDVGWFPIRRRGCGCNDNQGKAAKGHCDKEALGRRQGQTGRDDSKSRDRDQRDLNDFLRCRALVKKLIRSRDLGRYGWDHGFLF